VSCRSGLIGSTPCDHHTWRKGEQWSMKWPTLELRFEITHTHNTYADKPVNRNTHTTCTHKSCMHTLKIHCTNTSTPYTLPCTLPHILTPTHTHHHLLTITYHTNGTRTIIVISRFIDEYEGCRLQFLNID